MSMLPSHLPAGVLRAEEGEHLVFLGTTTIYKSLGQETDGAAFIWETQTPHGAMVPPHIHTTEDEFVYLVEGELEATLGEQTYTVRPGDLLKMPRNVPHALRSTGPALTKSLWMVIPAGKMEGLFRALAALPQDQPPDPAKVVAIFLEHDIQPVMPPGA